MGDLVHSNSHMFLSSNPLPNWLSFWRSSLCSIGKQFVTRYEGDLVAKCYFAKRKLLWEFLEGGVKSKIEFHWSDITAIKAVFFEGGHGALDIVLARPPLFFREIDPQPRKHIQWQATQDFTNGQACIHRRHILQCPQTSLRMNFEKLINCDPHLKLLSQQPDLILESPYFDPLLNQQPDIILESPYFDPLLNQQPDIILESSYFDPLLSQQHDIILESPYFDPQYSDILLASPYFDPQYSVLEGKSDFKSHINDVIKDDSKTTFSGFYEPGPPCATSSISNKTETQDSFWRTPAFDSQCTPSPCSGNNISSNFEELASGNTSLPRDALFNEEDFISQLLDFGFQPPSAASDEQSNIPKVNSRCCLLQQDTVAGMTVNAQLNDQDGGADDAQAGAGSYDESYSTPEAEQSFLEFMKIPRIASFPRVLSLSYLTCSGKLLLNGRKAKLSFGTASYYDEPIIFMQMNRHREALEAKIFWLWFQVKPHTYCKAPGKKKLLIACGICSKTCSKKQCAWEKIKLLSFFELIEQDKSFAFSCVIIEDRDMGDWLSLWRSSLCSIGKQFVTRYEGDLVAKCYFAKRKLLWEFLEGGLKSKIEFHWSDITAIKAVFFEGDHGALDIVVRFIFSQFVLVYIVHFLLVTCWQMFISWQDHLFSSERLILNQGSIYSGKQLKILPMAKHAYTGRCKLFFPSSYEIHLFCCKLAQNLLSQQPDIILKSPYFDLLLNQHPDIILESPYFDPLLSQQPDIILESSYFDPLLSQQPDIILESPYFDPQYSDIILASSYFDPQYSVLEGKSDFKSHINDVIKDDSKITFSGFYEPGPPCATSSIFNKTETQDSFWRTPVFHSQYTPSPFSVEELASGNTSLPCDALFDEEDFISQLLDFDFQPPSAASDEQSNIPKVNSLCCLLQQDTVASMTVNAQVNDQDGSADDAQAAAGSYDESYSTPEVEQSFSEFMMIPRIASFPRVLSQSYLITVIVDRNAVVDTQTPVQAGQQVGVHPSFHGALPLPELLQQIVCHLRPPLPAHLLQQGPVGQNVRRLAVLQHVEYHLDRRRSSDRLQITAMSMARSESDCAQMASATSLEVNPGRRRSIHESNCFSREVRHRASELVLELGVSEEASQKWRERGEQEEANGGRIRRKSCGEAAELGVLRFLLWISFGGMDWSTPHLAPPPPAGKLEVEEPLYEKRVRLHKRARDTSTSSEQFVTRYEGDLVAKCYFAKRKLLWEFLEGGVKSKIEFHWSDITAIKAVFFDGGHGALDIVLARPPLFFREIDPQPRKHIQWQATQDFTNGQAHIHRRHILQCPQTSLRKNFEKLINCDPHLKLLSQQPDLILESPYFDPLLNQQPDIILESPYFDSLLNQQPGKSDFKSHINDVIKDDSKTTFSGFYEPGPPCATSSISNKTETQDSFWRTPAFDSQCTPSPCSVEELASGNTSLPRDALFNEEDFISQLLDFGFQPPSAASDEQSNIPKVNSRCCLLQQDTVAGMMLNAQLNDQDGGADDAQAGAGSYDESYSTPEAEQSFLEFMKIPRIASFPRVLSLSYLT
ncbi:hypothetical protein ZIOFF_049591 [Zingiber officinale]|uniref:TRF2/HOY1 PH-like domain-containing protein n=1 Tax=Zingiber officinale TaxID=94328 RepID=A0A8J5KNM3_ZINOF|nr:hypothetical protein ZIOFF_049591 [Zingiber officinale]